MSCGWEPAGILWMSALPRPKLRRYLARGFTPACLNTAFIAGIQRLNCQTLHRSGILISGRIPDIIH
jgi:hypothetical protein